MGETTPHAIRWALREVKREMRLDYTRWHWTEDADRTVCGRAIPVGGSIAFLPETDERREHVTCKGCKRRKAV